MSGFAEPDVDTDEGLPQSVQDGLTGGDFGEGGSDGPNTSSLSAILQAQQDEPVAEGTPEGTTPEADDNSQGAAPPPEGFVTQDQYDHLQSAYGRQGNELGDLRREVAELRGYMEGAGQFREQPQQPQAFQTVPFVTEEMRDGIEEAMTQPGANPAQMAAWAFTNQPHLYETILDVWADQGGAAARRAAQFDMRLQQAVADQQAQESQQSEDQFTSELQVALDQEVKELSPEFGFVSGNEQHEKLLADTLSNAPEAIQDLVVSRDPLQRAAGLRAVFAMARVAGGVTTPEADGAAQQALAAAQAQARGQAALGTGGLRPVVTQAPTLTEQEQIEAAVARRLMTRPTTSVSEGLTGGQFGPPR